MNYQIFKSIIDSIVNNFKCESCSSNVGENNIDIIGAAGNSLNVDVICPNCHKHSVVRAEVANMNLGSIGGKDELKEKLIKTFSNLKSGSIKQSNKVNNVDLNDNIITDLSKTLKHDNLRVEDFLNEL